MQQSLFGLKSTEPDPTELLFVCKVIGSDEISTDDAVSDQINQLSEKVDAVKEELKQFTEEKLQAMFEELAEKLQPSEKEKKEKEAAEKKAK